MRAQRGSGAVRSTSREERNALRKAVRVSLSRCAAAALHAQQVMTAVAACGRCIWWQVAVEHAWPEAGWDPVARPPPLMLGVLSGDVRLAVRALRDYAQALGFDFLVPESKVVALCGHCVGCASNASARTCASAGTASGIGRSARLPVVCSLYATCSAGAWAETAQRHCRRRVYQAQCEERLCHLVRVQRQPPRRALAAG